MTTAPAAPDRSLAQRRAALANANAIRIARARLKRQLKPDRSLDRPIRLILDPATANGALPPSEAREAPPHFAYSMHVDDFLEHCCSGVSRVKASTILKRTAVSPRKTLAGLTMRQRHALVAELAVIRRGRGYGVWS